MRLQSAAADSRARRVLVADDDIALAELIRIGLCAAGYEVVVAHDGYGALRLLHGQTFDVLLTDLIMPGLTGDVLAERAREIDPTLPLLLMTASRRGNFRDPSWQDVIQKPFAIELLVAAIDAATFPPSAA